MGKSISYTFSIFTPSIHQNIRLRLEKKLPLRPCPASLSVASVVLYESGKAPVFRIDIFGVHGRDELAGRQLFRSYKDAVKKYRATCLW